MNAETLLPCPFCGSNDLRTRGDDKIVATCCENCQANGPNHYGSYEWNTRAADNIALREALRNLIDRYDEVVTTPDCSCSRDDHDVQQARAVLNEQNTSAVLPG